MALSLPGYQRAYAATTVMVRTRGVLLPAAGAYWRPYYPGTDNQFTGALFGDPLASLPLSYPAQADERGTIEVWAQEPVRLELSVWGDGFPAVRQVVDLIYTSDPEGLIDAHVASPDPHGQYATDVDLSDHLAAADPHNQYATDADLAGHLAAADPHAQYATDTDLSGHLAAADPHPGYLTTAEGNALIATLQSQVATLQTQVATLQTQMTGHTHEAGDWDFLGGEAVMPA